MRQEGTGNQGIMHNSQRAKDGKISIIRKKCPYCGHPKAMSKNSGIYCTKCKKRIK